MTDLGRGREARTHLKRRKWTSRDIILLCPWDSWTGIGKYREWEARQRWACK